MGRGDLRCEESYSMCDGCIIGTGILPHLTREKVIIERQVTVYDGLPSGVSPSYTIWAPNDSGFVFFGLDDKPFRLGKIFCNNRP